MNKYLDDYNIVDLQTEIAQYRDGYYAFRETVFYGEKGGMLRDEGTINGLKVIDLKYEDDILWHKVDGELDNPIIMKVDRQTRIINTTVQSALHLLDGYYARMDAYIPSVGVNPEDEWYEVNIKSIDDEHLIDVEAYMNEVIASDTPLTVTYMNGKDYGDPHYQKFDELRIVSYGNYDSQPCGTLHVSSTKDIGNFVILSKEKTSRGTKVHFSCSNVTALKLKHDHEILNNISKTLNVSVEEARDRISEMNDSLKNMKKEINDLKNEILKYKAMELKDAPKVSEYKCDDAGELRNVANVLADMVDDDRILYAYIDGVLNIAVLSKKGNARNIFNELKTKFNVNGGGSPKVALGKYTGSEDIIDELDKLI